MRSPFAKKTCKIVATEDKKDKSKKEREEYLEIRN